MGESEGTGEVTCPHCGYSQPATEEHQGADPQKAATELSQASTSDLDRTMQDMKMPWADVSGEGGEGGLEPISFDDLEELEELLRDDPRDRHKNPEAPPPPLPRSRWRRLPSIGSLAAASRNKPSVGFSTGEVPDDEPEDTAPTPAPTADPRTIWRLKSAAGLTYSFFDVAGLSRWAEGLDNQANLLVSIDGIVWKPFSEFSSGLAKGDTAIDAFRSANVGKPVPTSTGPTRDVSVPGRKPTTTATRTGTPARSKTRAGSRTRAGNRTRAGTRNQTQERPKTSNSLEQAMEDAVAHESGQTNSRGPRAGRVTQERARPNRATKTGSFKLRAQPVAEEANPWPGRLASMGVGVFVGGAAVYFGMYLLGFYDLTFTL